MEIRSANYEDKEFDACGGITVAVIDFGYMDIPLCRECLDNLRQSLKQYDETIFCHLCAKFKMSPSGWKYGGSCCKDNDVPEQHVGYWNCKGCLDTCKDAIRKE